MSGLIEITSGALTAAINPLGAELTHLRDAEGRELMTDADPAFWTGHAPILFPIVGALNGDSYRVGGQAYRLPKHGFARRSLFERTGVFDEALGGGGPLKSSQDFDLAYRAFRRNAVILLRPEVIVRHDGRREIEDWPALLRAYGFGDGAFYSKHARCRDAYATWLAAKNFATVSAKVLIKRALGRRPAEFDYLSGFVQGVRGGLKFSVDRTTLLYTEKN